MDDQKISVTLTGPAKVNGVREPEGATVIVNTTNALQLAASGLINPDQVTQQTRMLDMSDTYLEADFEKAVVDASAGRMNILKTVHSLEIAKLQETVANQSQELAGNVTALETARTSLAENVTLLTAANTRIAELEKQISDQVKPDDADLKGDAADSAKPPKTPK